MRILALAPAFLLFGCASKPPIEIKIPVAVPCIKEQPVAPTYPTAAEDAGIFERVKVLLAERELRKGYEAKLQAMLAACGEIK
jgi:hypothetical protein